MKRKKYIYHYFHNGVEVSKGDFRKSLGMHCCKVYGNSPNPFLNIGVCDTKELDRIFNRLKRKPNSHHLFVGNEKSDQFHIKREEVTSK